MRGKFMFGAASAALLAACFAGSASAQTADPAGDASTTARINVGDSVTSDLAPAGDHDWYRLSVTPNMSYTISLDGIAGEGEEQGFDPLVVVYSTDSSELARNDDAETLNSRLSYHPDFTGDVFIEARGFLDEAVGSYNLRVEAHEVPPDDVGNSAEGASHLNIGTAANGVIGEEGDEDWYHLPVRTDRLYRVSLNGADSNGLGDPLLRVVDSEGNDIAYNDDSNESLNSFVEFVPRQNGDYYVVASAFGGTTGAYTLNAVADRLPPDDAGNSPDRAARIALGATRDGELGYPGDIDVYRLRLEGGQSYRFTLNSPEGDRNFDPIIRVVNREGEELAVDDDGGDGLNSYLEFVAPADGDYYLQAQGFSEAASGLYALSAAAGDIPADASTDAALSAQGDYREGVLAPEGDVDWYKVDLGEGESVRVSLNSAEGQGGALGDPYLAVHGADGGELASDDDGGDGLNSYLEFTAPSAGAYFFEVRGFSQESASGRYALSLANGEIGASVDSGEYLAPNSEGRTSQIGAPDDVDWFAIDLVEGRPYRFNLESTDFDPVLTLFDAEGKEVATDDDGGDGANAYLAYTSTAGGSYYAAVSSYASSSQGHYTLRATDTEVPNGMSSDERLNAGGDDRASAIDFRGDQDGWMIELAAGTQYTIEINGSGDNPLSDPILTLLNSSNETAASDDNSGPGRNARLVYTPETSDVFYVQAGGANNSTGGYNIVVTPAAQ